MRQLVYVRPRQLEWQEAEEPSLQGSGDALVRPLVVASCDLDGAIIRGQAPIRGPFALGHEFVARVLSVSPDVQMIAPGQIVAVPFAISCGHCAYCQLELTASCSTVPQLAMFGVGAFGGNWGGALADVVRIPFADAMLVPVPDGVSLPAIASVGDNTADAWRTVAPYRDQLREGPVLIIGGSGPGSIGLYTVLIARALGAVQVDYVDWDANRLRFAQDFGAQVFEGVPEKRDARYPVTVDASARPEGLSFALHSTAPEGVCTSTGIYYSAETPVPLLQMYTQGITFRTSRASSRADMPEILAMIQRGDLHPELVTTDRAAWDDAPDAFRDYRTKLVVTRTGEV